MKAFLLRTFYLPKYLKENVSHESNNSSVVPHFNILRSLFFAHRHGTRLERREKAFKSFLFCLLLLRFNTRKPIHVLQSKYFFLENHESDYIFPHFHRSLFAFESIIPIYHSGLRIEWWYNVEEWYRRCVVCVWFYTKENIDKWISCCFSGVEMGLGGGTGRENEWLLQAPLHSLLWHKTSRIHRRTLKAFQFIRYFDVRCSRWLWFNNMMKQVANDCLK